MLCAQGSARFVHRGVRGRFTGMKNRRPARVRSRFVRPSTGVLCTCVTIKSIFARRQLRDVQCNTHYTYVTCVIQPSRVHGCRSRDCYPNAKTTSALEGAIRHVFLLYFAIVESFVHVELCYRGSSRDTETSVNVQVGLRASLGDLRCWRPSCTGVFAHGKHYLTKRRPEPHHSAVGRVFRPTPEAHSPTDIVLIFSQTRITKTSWSNFVGHTYP